MRSVMLVFGFALALLPAIEAAPSRADLTDVHYYYHNGNRYRYHWHGGYYNYHHNGLYYANRFRCGPRWCYR